MSNFTPLYTQNKADRNAIYWDKEYWRSNN